MIAMLLTALFTFAGLLAIAVLSDSAYHYAPAFLAIGKTSERQITREVRYTLITTEVRAVPRGTRSSIARRVFSLPAQPSRLAA